MATYGTEIENTEKQQILQNLPNATLVDPGSYRDNPKKLNDGIGYCLNLVEKCDALSFTRFSGKITAGVGLEINHALTKNKPVYELKKGKLRIVKKPVKHLSRDDTNALYRLCRSRELIKKLRSHSKHH